MNVRLAPKYVVLDDFLPDELVSSLDQHVRKNSHALDLLELEGSPGSGGYSASRKLWMLRDGLGPFEERFCAAVAGRAPDLCAGTGVAPFEVARVETKVCAQRFGSYFGKHVDTDTGEDRPPDSDRMISAVYYFPREPITFSGGELVLYDFTGKIASAQVAPRRNRLVAFPSSAYHEVTPLVPTDDTLDGARWSVSCWLHRAR